MHGSATVGFDDLLNWHFSWELSFLQLGLRELASLCFAISGYRCPSYRLYLMATHHLIVPICANYSRWMDCRIEFSCVTKFLG